MKIPKSSGGVISTDTVETAIHAGGKGSLSLHTRPVILNQEKDGVCRLLTAVEGKLETTGGGSNGLIGHAVSTIIVDTNSAHHQRLFRQRTTTQRLFRQRTTTQRLFQQRTISSSRGCSSSAPSHHPEAVSAVHHLITQRLFQQCTISSHRGCFSSAPSHHPEAVSAAHHLIIQRLFRQRTTTQRLFQQRTISSSRGCSGSAPSHHPEAVSAAHHLIIQRLFRQRTTTQRLFQQRTISSSRGCSGSAPSHHPEAVSAAHHLIIQRLFRQRTTTQRLFPRQRLDFGGALHLWLLLTDHKNEQCPQMHILRKATVTGVCCLPSGPLRQCAVEGEMVSVLFRDLSWLNTESLKGFGLWISS
ncbi:hypothetical protein NN561_017159 [Cricetulus griseus]